MSLRILWLDNDPSYLDTYLAALHDEGYTVDVVTTVTQAEELLYQGTHEFIILDVMVPTKSSDEELRYEPELTEFGYKTGLRFYINNYEYLSKNRLPVLVLTVRLDRAILDEFVAAGLPRECFSTKYDLRDVSVFLDKIASLHGPQQGATALDRRTAS